MAELPIFSNFCGLYVFFLLLYFLTSLFYEYVFQLLLLPIHSFQDKELEREKRKALISEPVGEVRHTCHVGIDGTAFGLLQVLFHQPSSRFAGWAISI